MEMTIHRKKAFAVAAFFFILIQAIPFLIPDRTEGSMPVRKTLTGCVIGGRFFSIMTDPQTGRPVKAYPIRIQQNFDIPSYEGKTISVSGSLLPGDRFIITKGGSPAVIRDTCGRDNLNIIKKELIMEYRVSGYQEAKNRNFDKALRLTNKALYMDKTLCGTYVDRALVYYLKGDFTSGANDIKTVKNGRCRDRKDLNFLMLEEIGAILENSGRKADAINLYKMGLKSCQSEMCRESMNKALRKASGS
ncbi:MAG: hypothetical protein BWX99_02092 [Deltaproteobacteria bacterium ADurb.Bin151]|jgi:hypothetical protein|nr:MAG: hypothetical protein BWX99_02092 [Deltaproteobacteria bacterium ADurb.Bin151]HQP24596.1 hypothetical protein [Smithellaceae bacterium]